MTNLIQKDDEEIDGLNGQLTVAYIKYLKLNHTATDNNKSALAREINTLYMQLAVMAVDKGLEDLYQIPDDITKLVRRGELTMQDIPGMVQPFNEPVIEMHIDEALIDKMKYQEN